MIMKSVQLNYQVTVDPRKISESDKLIFGWIKAILKSFKNMILHFK